MKILVFGWHNKHNLGDHFFIEAFENLFPNIHFIFTDYMTVQQVKSADAVFIGGGSFLFAQPDIEPAALSSLYLKKIFYIGVGGETEIHATHEGLISKAIYVACRSPKALNNIKSINKKAQFIPDLVYSLQQNVKLAPRKHKSVLVIPNITVVPKVSDPHWKHAAWAYFKSEFCQFLDWLVDAKYHIKFLPMCTSNCTNDNWATAELIAHMNNRNNSYSIIKEPRTFSETAYLCSQFETIITQRFHGIILAEMTETPYIALPHHDKLSDTFPNNGEFLSYYNVNKASLIDSFLKLSLDNTPNIVIEPNIYKKLANDVIRLL